MRKILAATAATLIALAACGDSTGPNAHVGVYTLTSVNGQSLPEIVFQDATTTVEFLDGDVTLNENGTFVDRLDFRVTDDFGVEEATDIFTGTYTLTGNNVTFHPSDGGTHSMTLTGNNTLTQTEPGLTLIYEK